MADNKKEEGRPVRKMKKQVSILAPEDGAGGGGGGGSPARGRGPPRRKWSMGPKQMSMKAFTPDNYSSDEDDKFFHEDAECAVEAALKKEKSEGDGERGGGDGEGKEPGAGWTNGQVPPQFTPAVTLHPFTRSGRLALYNHHRRWINFRSSWTRIGAGSTEMDARHSASAGGKSIMTGCLIEEGKAVRALVAQLCEKFYEHGWATGTGGGVSIRVGGPAENRPYRVFVAPSGVQKEDMVGDDVFELDMDRNVVAAPRTPMLRQSACTPLWYVVYRRVPKASCVIHTHSMHAQLATLLDPTETSDALRVTHLEMLKGVGNHSYDDFLEVPIIDNRPTEDQLAEQLDRAIARRPKCNAVLVRRHGLYVWGDSWEQAKAQCESFDYLFETAVKMKSMGLDCGVVPTSGTYHVKEENMEGYEEEEGGKGEEKKEDSPPSPKRRKVSPAPAFNAARATDNAADLRCEGTTIPLVPRDAKILLLDIEGTTTSISFVKDVLFPYVLKNLDDYLEGMSDDDAGTLKKALLADLEKLGNDHPSNVQYLKEISLDSAKYHAACIVRALMAHDVKATGLKSFQGKMWKAGYASGELVGHLYPDFMPAMEWCKSHGVRVCIYSSGSVGAQKLLFGHTETGDVTRYFDGHFDTTSGSKRERESYATIAGELGAKPEEVVFASDLGAEIEAADAAGMKAVVAVRPGNAPLDVGIKEKYPVVRSLLQLCG